MRFGRMAGVIAASLALATTAYAERLTDDPLVEAEWLKNTLGAEDLVVVDIRAPSQGTDFYAAGHIPGAVNAPYGQFGWRTEKDGIVGQLPPIDDIAARIGSLGIDNDDHVVIVPFGKNSTDFGSATRVYWTSRCSATTPCPSLTVVWKLGSRMAATCRQPQRHPETASFTANFRPR